MTERFTSLADIQRERQRLAALRDASMDRVKTQWKGFNEVTRRSLVRHLLHGLFPTQGILAEAIAGTSRWALGGLASKSHTFGNKLFWRGLSWVVPMFLRRMDPEKAAHIAEEVKVSIDRVRRHMAERAAHNGHGGSDH